MPYNPNQPRDPAGTETGGQWTSGRLSRFSAAVNRGAGLPPSGSGFRAVFGYKDAGGIGGGTVHSTELVRGENGKLYIKKNYQTSNSTDATMYTPQAEVSAAIIAENLGIDNVPETILLKDLSGNYYTLQEYVDGEAVGKLRPIAESNPDTLADVAILDYITGNNDRHMNNMLYKGGDLYAIDNDAGNGLVVFSTYDRFDERMGSAFDFKDIFSSRLKDYMGDWKNISEAQFKSWFPDIQGNQGLLDSYWENFQELISGKWKDYR
jgi:hypothetical protein